MQSNRPTHGAARPNLRAVPLEPAPPAERSNDPLRQQRTYAIAGALAILLASGALLNDLKALTNL